MSKALVIPSVNFATNKLTTVTIGDSVPCTAISLSDDSISFTALTTETLTATLTPANTTDTLTWASSNDNVATVDNGVVTCKGLGTATITATCGEQTATCTVSVNSIVMDESEFVYILHKQNSGTDLANNKDYAGSYGSESGNDLKRILYLSDDETQSGYKALSGANELYTGKYPIMIPHGATTIVIASPNSLTLGSTKITYLDSTKQPTYSIESKGCKAVTDGIVNTSVSQNKTTYTIPTGVDGLDSFYFTSTFTTAIEGRPTGLTVTFA